MKYYLVVYNILVDHSKTEEIQPTVHANFGISALYTFVVANRMPEGADDQQLEPSSRKQKNTW